MPSTNYASPTCILLFGENTSWLDESRQILEQRGEFKILTHSDNRTILKLLERNYISLIIIDYSATYEKSDIVSLIHKSCPDIQIIVESMNSDVEVVVSCMKSGAEDFLIQPVSPNRLMKSVKTALESHSQQKTLCPSLDRLHEDALKYPEAFAEIISTSREIRSICHYTEVVAGSSQPVLISGETGVGKELFARAIHKVSQRKGAFVSVNVAGLDDPIFSDTLFGHKKSAFTGADQYRDGLISKAAFGTLFLDEIGDLNELSQIKLLRLLQEGEYYPVGADQVKKSTARIILATNASLLERIKQGKFRRDLYYRLCAHQIHIPALRERRNDIPALLDAFVQDAARHFGRCIPTISEEVTRMLLAYDFPGNIRELQAKVRDAVARNNTGLLTARDFPGLPGAVSQQPPPAIPDSITGSAEIYSIFGHLPTFKEIEDFLLVEALKLSEGNYAAAASLLGVARQTVSKRIKSINLDS